MNNKDLAKYLDITEQGLYKWKKSRPNLYKIVMEWKNGLNNSLVEQEINKYYNQLTKEEQEMYLAEMKARVLRRKLDAKG